MLLAKDLAVAFQKILDKASFLIKLNIPLNFKKKDLTTAKQGGLKMLRAPSTYEGAPKPTLDWEGRLKSWKQMQTSLGAIKSLTERKVEIWNSGITAILALLQTPIEASKIQEQVEQTYIDSCRRCAGFKLIKDLIVGEMPFSHLEDLISWFASALRNNANRLTHYLDDTAGQGIHLEARSRQHFFEILGSLVARLKASKVEKEIKVLLNAFKWSYTARDHGELVQLNLFSVLHKGSNDADSLLKKSWGRKVKIDCSSLDDQALNKDVLEMFEQLFLTVAGRVVQPDDQRDNAKGASGKLPQLAKARSVVDDDVSEVLLG